jgi:hypothetical protein
MAVLWELPLEILHIIVDLLLADGNIGHVVGKTWTCRSVLALASCSWYYRHFCVERGFFWRVDSSLQCHSSVTGQILRSFGPPPVSLMVDLAAPDTWALCRGVLKAFPRLEEIGFLRKTCDQSPIDLETLSSQLCHSGFQGTRLVLKDAWLGCKDLLLFEVLEKLWGNVTTLSILQAGLIPEDSVSLPSKFFGSALPNLQKLVICARNDEFTTPGSHALYQLVELILSSSKISQFEISCVGSTDAPAELSETPRKGKLDFLNLLRKHAAGSLTTSIDNDEITGDTFLETLTAYDRSLPSPFEMVRFCSFRFGEPEMEEYFYLWFLTIFLYFGISLECILVETVYNEEPHRELRVSKTWDQEEYCANMGLLDYHFPGGVLPNLKIIIGNGRDGYLLYHMDLSWPSQRVLQRRHLSQAECKSEVEKYLEVQGRRQRGQKQKKKEKMV